MLFIFTFFTHLDIIECIMGGHSITITDAPYHLGYGDNCGAVLIHKRWALTAAHCGSKHKHVNIGSTKHLKGTPIAIADHIIHPLYQKEHDFDYDIQLLRFYQNLRFKKNLKPITIGEEHGNILYISGWGYPKEKGDYQDVLHRAKIKMVDKKTCQQVKKSVYQKLTPRMFCAGGWKQDACQGDSGGGAVSMKNELVGISSFGYGCGRGIPGVYTNITNKDIRSWILEHTGI